MQRWWLSTKTAHQRFRCYQYCKGRCHQHCTTGERCYQSCSIDGNCQQSCTSTTCVQRCTKGVNCNMTCNTTDHCEQVCWQLHGWIAQKMFLNVALTLNDNNGNCWSWVPKKKLSDCFWYSFFFHHSWQTWMNIAWFWHSEYEERKTIFGWPRRYQDTKKIRYILRMWKIESIRERNSLTLIFGRAREGLSS